MRVPYTGVPDVQPAGAPPEDYLRIQAPPGAFGAQVAQAGEQLGQKALQASDVYSEIAAQQAVTSWRQETNKLLFGDSSAAPGSPEAVGLYGLHGQAAMEAKQPTLDRIREITEQHAGQLYTSRSQIAFNNEARYYQSRIEQEIGQHYDRESQAWGIQTNGDQIAQSIADAALRPENQDAADLALGRANAGSFKRLQLQGLSGNADAVNREQRENLINITEARINALEGRNTPESQAAAAKLFHDNLAVLSTGRNFESFSRRMNAADDKATGRAAALQAWGGLGGGSVGPPAHGLVTPQQVSEAAQAGGVDPKLANATAAIESGHGSAAENKISPSHQGIFQLGPDERAAAGGSRESIGSLDDQVKQGVATLATVKQNLATSLGREPTNAEIYLAHQQGVSGATKLINNPNTPAGQLVPPVNISNNAGDPNAPASQFVQNWEQRYARVESRFSTGGAPDTAAPRVPGAQLASAGQPPALANAPTREELIARIPEGLSDNAYAHAYTEVNRLYSHWEQATSSSRAQLKQSIRNGIPMLEDGRDFPYDENQIRSLLPSDQAETAIDLLADAKAVGQQKTAVQGMSLSDALTQQAANHAQLANAPPGEYIRMKRMADAFDKASDQHFKALGADPAGYLSGANPEIERLRQMASNEPAASAAQERSAGQPTAFERYASALLEEEDRLQVPPAAQHVLSTTAAPGIVQSLMADPAQAPEKMRQMQESYGTAWPHVWNDLVTIGKMPTAFQAVGIIEPHMAMRLTQGLADERGDETKKGNQVWEALLGAPVVTGSSGVIQSTRNGPGMQDFLTSMRTGGATAPEMDSFLHAVNTTAFSLMVHEGLPQADAVDKAARSFTSLYGYMGNGGARVPIAQFDNVTRAASAMVETLSSDFVRVPPGFGDHPGAPSVADYIEAIKGNPTWVNGRDGVELIDNGGRRVLGKDGKGVSIPFNTPAPAATPSETPTGPPVPPF